MGQAFGVRGSGQTHTVNVECHPEDDLHQKEQVESEDSAGGSQVPSLPGSLQGGAQGFSVVYAGSPRLLELAVEQAGSEGDRKGVFLLGHLGKNL